MIASRPLRRLLAAASTLAVLATQAGAFDTSARAAFVLDYTTGTVLMAKNADEAMPPASMSKLMTLYMAFEAIHDGRLTLDERLYESEQRYPHVLSQTCTLLEPIRISDRHLYRAVQK